MELHIKSDILIRTFNPGTDRASTIALWKSVFSYDVAIDNKVSVGDGLFYVACEGNEIIGTVMAGYDGHRGWIYSVAVKPDSRNRGVGGRLVAHAEAALRDRQCLKVNLQVLDNNPGAVAFYRKAGYVVEQRISMGKLLR